MLSLLLAGLLACSAPGEPFADLEFDAALAQSKNAKKLLILDFTASWCGPCKSMEKDTWPDAGVRAWLAEHALAIQIDVDAEPALAKRFRVTGIPLIVALRDGEEFDRSVGYLNPAGFLKWGRNVAAGRRANDDLRERARSLEDSADVDQRYDLARNLLRGELYPEALSQYLWLWPATRDVPAMHGVRLSFMLTDMAQLAQQHEPARQAFLELLEGVQARVGQSDPVFLDWQEWTAFCKHFGQRERIVTWYETHRDESGRLFAGQETSLSGRISADVFDALMEGERPMDAVRLYPSARVRAEAILLVFRQMEMPTEGLEEEIRTELEDSRRRTLIQDLSRFYGALLAAERRAEAAEIAQMLLDTLDTPGSRIGLMRASLDIGQQEECFVRWLDEAEAAGGRVRSLRRSLEKLQRKDS